MIRIFDVTLAFFGLVFGAPLLLLIYVLGLFDTGTPLFCQVRVGRNKKPFLLFKFRTMQLGTVSAASHLVDGASITKLGRILRRTKLDELPQLFNVLMGDMSFVGPRPCLFNQKKLINERDRLNVFRVRPGITGASQLAKIDMSTPLLLANVDSKMLDELSIRKYFSLIFLTAIGRGSGDSVKPPVN